MQTYSQENVEKVGNYPWGLTYYDGFSTGISSLSEINQPVKNHVEEYLKMTLGNLTPSLHFAYGQIVDLKNYFLKNHDTYKREWLIPKYDLLFVLKDSVVSLDFALRLRIDQYGQILNCNWPKKGYSDKNQLKSFSDVETVALQAAARNGFNLNQYEKFLFLNERQQILYWVFQFQKERDSGNGLFNTLEVDWKSLEIVDEYEMRKQTVY